MNPSELKDLVALGHRSLDEAMAELEALEKSGEFSPFDTDQFLKSLSKIARRYEQEAKLPSERANAHALVEQILEKLK